MPSTNLGSIPVQGAEVESLALESERDSQIAHYQRKILESRDLDEVLVRQGVGVGDTEYVSLMDFGLRVSSQLTMSSYLRH